mgnify:CR=1 FL=1
MRINLNKVNLLVIVYFVSSFVGLSFLFYYLKKVEIQLIATAFFVVSNIIVFYLSRHLSLLASHKNNLNNNLNKVTVNNKENQLTNVNIFNYQIIEEIIERQSRLFLIKSFINIVYKESDESVFRGRAYLWAAEDHPDGVVYIFPNPETGLKDGLFIKIADILSISLVGNALQKDIINFLRANYLSKINRKKRYEIINKNKTTIKSALKSFEFTDYDLVVLFLYLLNLNPAPNKQELTEGIVFLKRFSHHFRSKNIMELKKIEITEDFIFKMLSNIKKLKEEQVNLLDNINQKLNKNTKDYEVINRRDLFIKYLKSQHHSTINPLHIFPPTTANQFDDFVNPPMH